MNNSLVEFQIKSTISQFKVPIEFMKNNCKNLVILIEKEKCKILNQLKNFKLDSSINNKKKKDLICSIIFQFKTFKNDINKMIEKDEDYRSRLKARIDELKLLNTYYQIEVINDQSTTCNLVINDNKEKVTFQTSKVFNWFKDQSVLLIIDYLIKSNVNSKKNIGINLLKKLSVSKPKYLKLIDFDLLENFNQIFISIIKFKNLNLVRSWYQENKSSLKKFSSNLDFEIDYCNFLSLLSCGQTIDAINFSKSKLSFYINKNNYNKYDVVNYKNNLTKLKFLGGLLFYSTLIVNQDFDKNKISTKDLKQLIQEFKKYEKILSNKKWINLLEYFYENFTKLYEITKIYPLHIYLSAGLSSLKTKSCFYNQENTIFASLKNDKNFFVKDLSINNELIRNPKNYYKILKVINKCPICSPELYKLSINLPYAQLVTNVFNDPLKLPNGNIYSYGKLLNYLKKNEEDIDDILSSSKIKDPLTNENFLLNKCVKVFPA